ncbi:MAG: hypothetical protein IJ053_06350 [Lachnospiraceae bacterium]|nr:hypothetical protein [Lachnospiraceae bacterium]
MAVIFVIVFISARSFIKKNNKSKQLQAEKMNDLNTFILQYEASKKVEAEKEKNDAGKVSSTGEVNVISEKTDQTVDENSDEDKKNSESSELDAETIGRIKALYFDAEMPVEKIADKTGVSVEQIEKVVV